MSDTCVQPRRMRKLPLVMLALLRQLVTFSDRLFALSLSLFSFAMTYGLLAAVFSYLAKQARWWLPIQLLFVPALALNTNIPPFVFLLVFLLMLLLYWRSLGGCDLAKL